MAAMSLNRVIGKDGKIPWHLPEDFKWFKGLTMGHRILMGRKTFDSLGRKALPGRISMVVSRTEAVLPGVVGVSNLDSVNPSDFQEKVFVIGGAQIYEELLPRCSDLYLSLVNREVEGDAFFPDFEFLFDLAGVELETPDFKVLHYRSNNPQLAGEA